MKRLKNANRPSTRDRTSFCEWSQTIRPFPKSNENRSVYSAIPKMERMRIMAKKQRNKRRDPDPMDLESDVNMSEGSKPGGNRSASSRLGRRSVVSLSESETHFSKKLRKLDLAFRKSVDL